MASVSFQVPVALILLAGGLLACFMGYRLLRPLLALYGFVGGLVLSTLFTGTLDTLTTILVMVTGGLVGAVLAVVAYLAGVAMIGAGLGAAAVSLVVSGGDPNLWVMLGACLVGALLALAVRRHVLITVTSFGGAWTALVGGMALSGNAAALAATRGELERLPPLGDPDNLPVFIVGWVILGAGSMVVQLRTLGRRRLAARQADADAEAAAAAQ